MYSRTMTQAHKDKISQAMKGKRHTDFTKQKISQAIRKKWMSATPTQPTKPTEPTEPTEQVNNKNLTPNKNGKK